MPRRFQSADELAQTLRGKALASHPFRSRGPAPGLILAVLSWALITSLTIPAVRERLSGISFSSHEKHIAVLPFDTTGESAEAALLSDGLMDSLT
jgi:hypothetical protein